MGEARKRQEAVFARRQQCPTTSMRSCRTAVPFSSAIPGPQGREEVRVQLEQLLTNRDFVETYCGDHVPRGLKCCTRIADLGFQVLAHINDKARVSPPHDHGASWAIYGQATHYTDMIEWEREDDGRSRTGQAQAGQEVSAAAGPCRHLPGRQDPFDRLSRQRALHPRDRHQSRQYPSRALRSRVRQGPPDDAAAGD